MIELVVISAIVVKIFAFDYDWQSYKKVLNCASEGIIIVYLSYFYSIFIIYL